MQPQLTMIQFLFQATLPDDDDAIYWATAYCKNATLSSKMDSCKYIPSFPFVCLTSISYIRAHLQWFFRSMFLKPSTCLKFLRKCDYLCKFSFFHHYVLSFPPRWLQRQPTNLSFTARIFRKSINRYFFVSINVIIFLYHCSLSMCTLWPFCP